MSIQLKLQRWFKEKLFAEKFAVFAGIATLTASIGVMVNAIGSFKSLEEKTSTASSQLRVDAEFAELRRDVERLRVRLRAIQAVAASGVSVSDEAVRIQQVDARLSTIEQGLVETPEKALSVPMMRRDLAALERSSDMQIQSLREDVGRLYTLMVWLIGIIVTISLGLVSLIFARSKVTKFDADPRNA